jgi:uncharacterized FlgJ-related protein
LFSCQIIDKKVPTEQELFEKQIKEINWSEVDEYPSFLECDKISDNDQRKQCFFEFMATTIQQKLSVEDLAVLYPQLDTIEVKVTVFPDASLQFEPQFESDSLAYDKIKIDSILKRKLIDFPKVNPALKRGIPVKTEFVLPVIIKSN